MVRKTGVNTRGEEKDASGFDRGAKTHHIQQSIPCVHPTVGNEMMVFYASFVHIV